jgi:predicted alpha/beta-hydrolase family hydrolase
MRIVKWVLVGVVAAILLALAGFTIWAYTPLGPMPEALAALQSDEQVQVESGPWLTFRPTSSQPDTGLIFYPGGRVDYRSYAPLAREIARQGYTVVIVPMPFNLAVFGAGRASDVIAAHPEIQHWAIGGHSLGGAMAANYVYSHPDAVSGLALMAAYPAGNNSLADRNLDVLSIYGTEDGAVDQLKAARSLLPASTEWVTIEGGNHAGFGWYGPQPGDGTATISREEQQAQTVASVVALFSRMVGPAAGD